MTRSIKSIKAIAIFINEEGELARTTVTIPVQNYDEKTVERAISKNEKKHDHKIVKSSIEKIVVETKMTDDVWYMNCEIVSIKPYTEDSTTEDSVTEDNAN